MTDDGTAHTMHSPPARTTCARLTSWFQDLFDRLEALRDAISADLDDTLGPLLRADVPVTVSSEHSEGLRRLVARFLSDCAVADGAGVVLAPTRLKPETAELQWWRRDANGAGGMRRTEFILNPASERYYDYASLEWFRRGFREAKRTVAGPYIDYLGIDYYICTVTVPVQVSGTTVGVVGCDIRMQDLERAVLPLLSGLPDSALLGCTRQVLVGNTGRLSTGILIAAVPDGYLTIPLDIAGAELELLYHG